MSAQASAARRRHPSARWPAPVDALHHRVSQFLDLRGARHPDVAASLLEVRGRLGVDVVEFAESLGVESELVVRAESGDVSAARLPARLRRMVRSAEGPSDE